MMISNSHMCKHDETLTYVSMMSDSHISFCIDITRQCLVSGPQPIRASLCILSGVCNPITPDIVYSVYC